MNGSVRERGEKSKAVKQSHLKMMTGEWILPRLSPNYGTLFVSVCARWPERTPTRSGKKVHEKLDFISWFPSDTKHREQAGDSLLLLKDSTLNWLMHFIYYCSCNNDMLFVLLNVSQFVKLKKSTLYCFTNWWKWCLVLCQQRNVFRDQRLQVFSHFVMRWKS